MNKNGWGLRVELVIILLFLICLAMACIGLNKFGLLGDNNDPIIKEPTTENIKLYYEGLEDKLRVATREYYNAKYNDNNEDIFIFIVYITLTINFYFFKVFH